MILKYCTITFGYVVCFYLLNVYVLLENAIQKECTMILLEHQEMRPEQPLKERLQKIAQALCLPFLLKEQQTTLFK